MTDKVKALQEFLPKLDEETIDSLYEWLMGDDDDDSHS